MNWPVRVKASKTKGKHSSISFISTSTRRNSPLCPHLDWVFQLQGIWSRKSFKGIHICLPVVSSRCSQTSNQEEPSQPNSGSRWARCILPFPRGHHLWAQHRGCTTREVPALECQGRSSKSKANATSHRPFPDVWDLPLSTYHFPIYGHSRAQIWWHAFLGGFPNMRWLGPSLNAFCSFQNPLYLFPAWHLSHLIPITVLATLLPLSSSWWRLFYLPKAVHSTWFQ